MQGLRKVAAANDQPMYDDLFGGDEEGSAREPYTERKCKEEPEVTEMMRDESKQTAVNTAIENEPEMKEVEIEVKNEEDWCEPPPVHMHYNRCTDSWSSNSSPRSSKRSTSSWCEPENNWKLASDCKVCNKRD